MSYTYNFDQSLTANGDDDMVVNSVTTNYLNSISAQTLSYLDATSSIQTQFNNQSQIISGIAGATGTTYTSVSVGTTTTLTPGSSATVSNSGSPNNVILNFGIPQGISGSQGATGYTGPTGCTGYTGCTGAQGTKGDKGDKGEQGDQATSTLAAIAAASASAASAASAAGYASASATSAAAAQAAADSINTNFEARVEVLESKTESQYHYKDALNKNHTQFTDILEVVDSSLAPKIIMDASLQKVVSQKVWANNFDARTSGESLNIGTNSSGFINIGNPSTYINLLGTTNFNFNSITGIISQF